MEKSRQIKFAVVLFVFIVLGIMVFLLLFPKQKITTAHPPLLQSHLLIDEVVNAILNWEVTYGLLPFCNAESEDRLLTDKKHAQLIAMLNGDKEIRILLTNGTIIQNTKGIKFLNIKKNNLSKNGVLINQYGDSLNIMLDRNQDNIINISSLSGISSLPKNFNGKVAIYIDGSKTCKYNNGNPVISWKNSLTVEDSFLPNGKN